jgi:hypothetical protein
MTAASRFPLCFGLVLLVGCRFGSAPGDGLEFGLSDSKSYAGQSAPPPEAAETSEPPADASVPARPPASTGAAGATSKPTTASQASAAGKTAGATPARRPAADGCGAMREISGCDPMSNQGCLPELGMQCDVDLLADTPAGVCVFSAPPPSPDSCLNIPPTESCPPQTTCVGTSCAKICLCDTDCEAGDCCTTPVGGGGFKACGAC